MGHEELEILLLSARALGAVLGLYRYVEKGLEVFFLARGAVGNEIISSDEGVRLPSNIKAKYREKYEADLARLKSRHPDTGPGTKCRPPSVLQSGFVFLYKFIINYLHNIVN